MSENNQAQIVAPLAPDSGERALVSSLAIYTQAYKQDT